MYLVKKIQIEFLKFTFTLSLVNGMECVDDLEGQGKEMVAREQSDRRERSLQSLNTQGTKLRKETP